MEWLNEKWDRVLLAVVAFIVILASALFIKKSLAYPSTFETESTAPDSTLPIDPGQVIRVEKSTNLVTQEVQWVLPIRGEDEAKKPLPLFVSIPIVEVGGQLVDMNDPNARLVRPPASNKWLLDNNLDFLDAGVLDQDPDGDGFNNLEEWDAKTSPKDPSEHPAFYDKIYLVERHAQNYVLTFNSKLDAERFQIAREKSANYPRDTNILRIGETSKDGKFRLDGYEEKSEIGNLGTNVNVSEATITYLESGKQHKLVRRKKYTIPTHYAQLKFELSGKATWEEYIKEGASFKLPIDPDTEYTLISVEPEEAEISFQPLPGQEKKVKIKKKS